MTVADLAAALETRIWIADGVEGLLDRCCESPRPNA
jgi:hypothetical protein